MLHLSTNLLMILCLLALGCATTNQGNSTERAQVFKGASSPKCPVEKLGELTTMASVRGPRAEAERVIHSILAEMAKNRGADGIMSITLEAPDRVAFTVTDNRRPRAEDVPEVVWTGKAQMFRFPQPDCRN
jgi:hypothetical protein